MGYLSGPVNALTDYQIEFNGFLLGPGTAYDVPPTWDFLDMAALKTMDSARVWADGSWSGPDFADVLLPTVSLGIGGASQAAFTAAVARQLNGIFHATAAIGHRQWRSLGPRQSGHGEFVGGLGIQPK